VLKCEQLMTLPRSDLRPDHLGAALGPSRMDEVSRAILRAIGVPA